MADKREEYVRLLESGSVYGGDVINMVLSNAFGEEALEAATELAARFPGALAAFAAEYDELIAVPGVTKDMAAYMKSVYALLQNGSFYAREIPDGEALKDLVRKRLGEAENEIIDLYFTDKDGVIRETRSYTSGELNRAAATLKDILPCIVGDGVKRIYFAHNHVDGAATPSQRDDITTAKLAKVCRAFGLELYDHIIVGRGGTFYSYREHGRLNG